MNINLVSQWFPFIIFYFFIFFPYLLWKHKKDFAIYTLIYLYICFIVRMTLFPLDLQQFHWIPAANQINFNPFVDIQYSNLNAWQEATLNVLFFIPFGFILKLRPKAKIWNSLWIGSSTSLLIEMAQVFLTYHRIGDITDWLTNSFGCLIGILFAYLIYEKKFR